MTSHSDQSVGGHGRVRHGVRVRGLWARLTGLDFQPFRDGDSTLFAHFREMSVKFRNHFVRRFHDNLQTSAQFRQGLVFGP